MIIMFQHKYECDYAQKEPCPLLKGMQTHAIGFSLFLNFVGCCISGRSGMFIFVKFS